MEPKMLNELVKLPHAAQIIYLQLLNRAAQGTVTISDRDLASSCRLSKQTITEGKRLLKNSGLLDFKSSKAQGTRYELGHELGHEVGHEVGHLNNSNTNDLELPPPPPPPPPQARTDAKIAEMERRIAALEKAVGQLTRTGEVGQATRTAEANPLDEVIAQWDSRANFAPLGSVGMTKLQAMLERYSASELIAAMDEAELANKPRMGSPYSGVSFVFFEKVLAGRREAKPPKEVKKDDGGIKYRVPRSDGAKPWRKRDTIGESFASETSVG